MSLMFFCFVCYLLQSCASYGVISNKPVTVDSKLNYSMHKNIKRKKDRDLGVFLAFSGGGSRASALAYGVLKALKDTEVGGNNLLDQVDSISSVSGGSFTAAYYGLYGDKIFSNYKDQFLSRDIAGELFTGLFNPLLWFSSQGRTEMAVRHYEEDIFKGATFNDLHNNKNRPMIFINATDLVSGSRFTFTQEYFDLLCSDLNSFPIAKAVTASSAVPVVFNPVVLKNYDGCENSTSDWLQSRVINESDDLLIKRSIKGLKSYSNKKEKPYVHLVDGGITDNLGLQIIYESIGIVGGISNYYKYYQTKPLDRFLIISVNASAESNSDISKSNKIPSLNSTVNAVTDTQIHRTNEYTLELLKNSFRKWGGELSPNKDTQPQVFFVEISFESIKENKLRLFFNEIPTTFYLSDEQIELLTNAGYDLLINNPVFQSFLASYLDQ